MKTIDVACPMCDTANKVPETSLHIGEPVRCTGCYEVSVLTHDEDPESGEREWRLDYLQETDD